MTISLISPSLDSLQHLIHLSKKLHEHEALCFDETYVRNAFSYLIENPNHGHVFMISNTRDEHTEIIGFVVICYSFSIEYGGQIAIIDQIYLDADWRRQGVGSKILPILESHCRESGCFVINLELNIGNSGARKFYEQFDYMPRRQHCIMTKRIQ